MSYLDRIKADAEKQAKAWPVVVDGNRHFYTHPQCKVPQMGFDRARPVTRERCKELCQRIKEDYGYEVKGLLVLMTEVDFSAVQTEDDAAYVYSGDMDLPVKHKEARYDAVRDSLVIIQDGRPVYANDAGEITRDEVAIADSEDY